SPSASASASASPSASPSPSATSATPSPSESAEPSTAPTTPAPTVTTEGTEEDAPETTGPVLGRGDRGPEVTELQLRLRQLHLYNGDINGQFNRRVEDSLRAYQWARGLQDELGVYGSRTRARLESETREP
ncbi:peptidoglycan-binding domain-containing protein, partial [Streptomyces viridosporus]|uniref:peptidoglycan-binding domain-containing protein n=1 Tax=Streptomyces viridosporus TaxID=67581 RepID=UPI0009BE4736